MSRWNMIFHQEYDYEQVFLLYFFKTHLVTVFNIVTHLRMVYKLLTNFVTLLTLYNIVRQIISWRELIAAHRVINKYMYRCGLDS